MIPYVDNCNWTIFNIFLILFLYVQSQVKYIALTFVYSNCSIIPIYWPCSISSKILSSIQKRYN